MGTILNISVSAALAGGTLYSSLTMPDQYSVFIAMLSHCKEPICWLADPLDLPAQGAFEVYAVATVAICVVTFGYLVYKCFMAIERQGE